MGKLPKLEIDECRLIYEVEKRPHLYDFRHPMYRKITSESFAAIAVLLGHTEKQCRDRWKSIRDAFVRYKNLPTPSGSGAAEKGNPPKWYKELSFLTSNMKSRNVFVTANQTKKKRLRSTGSVFSQSGIDQVEERLLSILDTPDSNPKPADPKPHIPKEEDEMYYYAMSIVPALTGLSKKARREARAGIDRLLAELQDGPVPEQLTGSAAASPAGVSRGTKQSE